MKELTYIIQIDYINDFNEKVSVSRTIYDTGLVVNSISVNNICVVEETINRRILSGSYISEELECGYRYNYDAVTSDEYLFTINKELSLNETVNLINKTKMKQEFGLSMMIFNMVLRKDYKVITLKESNIKVSRKVCASDDGVDVYEYEEILDLTKRDEQQFDESIKRIVCKLNDNVLIDEMHECDEEIYMNDMKFNVLKEALDQNFRTYRDLLNFLNQVNISVSKRI